MVSDNLSRWRDTKGIRYIDASWNKKKKALQVANTFQRSLYKYEKSMMHKPKKKKLTETDKNIPSNDTLFITKLLYIEYF